MLGMDLLLSHPCQSWWVRALLIPLPCPGVSWSVPLKSQRSKARRSRSVLLGVPRGECVHWAVDPPAGLGPLASVCATEGSAFACGLECPGEPQLAVARHAASGGFPGRCCRLVVLLEPSLSPPSSWLPPPDHFGDSLPLTQCALVFLSV